MSWREIAKLAAIALGALGTVGQTARVSGQEQINISQVESYKLLLTHYQHVLEDCEDGRTERTDSVVPSEP